jgi:hypothetical protein
VARGVNHVRRRCRAVLSHVLHGTRRKLEGRQYKRWTAYVVLPFLVGATSLGLINFWVLGEDAPPSAGGIQFDVDASGGFKDAASSVTIGHLTRTAGMTSEMLPSVSTDLRVAVDGCDSDASVELDTYPDPRWWLALRAGRQGKPQRIAIKRGSQAVVGSAEPGAIKGIVAVTVPGRVANAKAYVWHGYRIQIPLQAQIASGAGGVFTMLRSRITNRALNGVLLRSVIGQEITFTFDAPWVRRRAFMSCFVVLPALVEGQALSLAPLGAAGLAVESATHDGAVGPEDATSRFTVTNGNIDGSATVPTPLTATTPTWYCHRDLHPTGPPQPDCHAIVVVNEPGQETTQQVLLIVLGALGSAGLLGTFDGMRRFYIPW